MEIVGFHKADNVAFRLHIVRFDSFRQRKNQLNNGLSIHQNYTTWLHGETFETA